LRHWVVVGSHHSNRFSGCVESCELSEHPEAKLVLIVKESRVLVLRGSTEDLDALAGRFSIPPAVAWSADGVECRAYRAFNGAFNGAIFKSVELVADDVVPCPPGAGVDWVTTPSAFGGMMGPEQAGLPDLPADFVATLRDLSAAGNRAKFMEAMLASKT